MKKYLLFLLCGISASLLLAQKPVYAPRWGIELRAGYAVASHTTYPTDGPFEYPGANYAMLLHDWSPRARQGWAAGITWNINRLSTRRLRVSMGVNTSRTRTEIKAKDKGKYGGGEREEIRPYTERFLSLQTEVKYMFPTGDMQPFAAMRFGAGWNGGIPSQIKWQSGLGAGFLYQAGDASVFSLGLYWTRFLNMGFYNTLDQLNLTAGWQFGRKQVYPRRTNRWWGGPGWK